MILSFQEIYQSHDAPYVLNLNSSMWSTSNFSQQYPYIVLQTGNENTQTDQVEIVVLISHQIPVTNLKGNINSWRGELTIRSWELKG